jgi:hypothetical protein
MTVRRSGLMRGLMTVSCVCLATALLLQPSWTTRGCKECFTDPRGVFQNVDDCVFAEGCTGPCTFTVGRIEKCGAFGDDTYPPCRGVKAEVVFVKLYDSTCETRDMRNCNCDIARGVYVGFVQEPRPVCDPC